MFDLLKQTNETRKFYIKMFFEGKLKPSILRGSRSHNAALSDVQKMLHANSLAQKQRFSQRYFQQQMRIITSGKSVTQIQKPAIDFTCYETIDYDALDAIALASPEKKAQAAQTLIYFSTTQSVKVHSNKQNSTIALNVSKLRI